VLDLLIHYGHSHYGSFAIGSSIGLTAFSFLLILATFQSRSETGSLLTMDTLDNPTLNKIAVAEIVLAILVTQAGSLMRLLGTTQLTLGQFGLALLPTLVLFALWEIGKLIGRRS
jgi:Ca2+-transporting ATPase